MTARFLLCVTLLVGFPATALADNWEARGKAAADYSAGLGGRALLVMVDGQVVFEQYDNGWSADRPHPLASGTKSFSGILAAAAIEDGYIGGWDANISENIKAWRDDPLKRHITLRQLLSLSSGLDARDPALESRGGGRLLGEQAAQRTRRIEGAGKPPAPDMFAAALAVEMTGEPGKQFAYGPSHFYAFGAYLEACLVVADAPQKTVQDYFQARIAEPIGLEIGRWGQDRAGHPNLPGGMMLTARQWARFGEFVRLGGAVRQADGTLKQVLAAETLGECFKRSENNPQYGLTWWLPGEAGPAAGDSLRERLRAAALNGQMGEIRDADGDPVTAYVAAGLGQQRLIVLPEQKMVIVRFAEGVPNGRQYGDAELLRLLLPASAE